jgi:hypothetical protein
VVWSKNRSETENMLAVARLSMLKIMISLPFDRLEDGPGPEKRLQVHVQKAGNRDIHVRRGASPRNPGCRGDITRRVSGVAT